MSSFFIFLLTLGLLLMCAFIVLLILMQRPSEESGMGSTLGGGAASSIFGGEAVNTLAKLTKYCVIIFFVLSFILSMFHMALEKSVRPKDLLEVKEVVASDSGNILESQGSINPDQEIISDDQEIIKEDPSWAPAQKDPRNCRTMNMRSF